MVLDHIWRPWPTITCHGDVSMVDRQLGSPLGRWYLNQALKDEKKSGRGTFQAEETGFSVTFPQIVFLFLPSPAIEVSIYQKGNNSWSWSGTRTVASSDMEIISVSKLFSSVSKRGILSISQAEHQGRLLRKTMGGEHLKISEKMMISTEDSTWSFPRKTSKISNYICWSGIWLISEKAVCSHREASPDPGRLYESGWLPPPPAFGASSTPPRASDSGHTWL